MNLTSKPNTKYINLRHRITSFNLGFWLLLFIVILLFCQFWVEVGGFTFRLQDGFIILLLANTLFLPTILKLKFVYIRNSLNLPILVWASVLVFGVILTFSHPFSAALKKDSLVNMVRLLLALSLFFVISNFRMDAASKARFLKQTIIGFSFVTTFVSLLQVGHWDGWLPFSLPPVLTTFAEGANTARGREIFGLFLGDTGSHTWASMLAMQALAVWLTAQQQKNQLLKAAFFSYFGVLCLILVRISVRNSILGLCT